MATVVVCSITVPYDEKSGRQLFGTVVDGFGKTIEASGAKLVSDGQGYGASSFPFTPGINRYELHKGI